MVTDTTSRLRQAVKLAVVLLVVGPLLAQWGVIGTDLVPTISTELLVRVAGLAIVAVILGLVVRQKRGSRGQRSSVDAPEEAEERQVEERRVEESGRADGRQVEGSGEVYAPYAYNNQQQARREGKRIQERAEEISSADRDASKRR